MTDPPRRRVRWTEHGPVEVVEESSDPSTSDGLADAPTDHVATEVPDVPAQVPPAEPASAAAAESTDEARAESAPDGGAAATAHGGDLGAAERNGHASAQLPRATDAPPTAAPVAEPPPSPTAPAGASPTAEPAPLTAEPADAAPPSPRSARRAARAARRAERRAEAEAAPALPEPESNDPEAATCLAARGMLRTEPSVRIRDVTEAPPRPEPRQREEVDLGTVAAEAAADPFDLLEQRLAEAEDLEPDPGGPTSPVACLSCRSTQQVSVAATGYRCATCTRVWRWAMCNACQELEVTLARQESWRCRSCGATTRSWWRTAEAPRLAVAVADRRQVDAARRRRSGAVEAIRRRRTPAIAAALTVAVVAAIVAAVAALAGSDGEAVDRRSAATCAAFRDLEADLAAGPIPAAALRARLDELAQDASDADDPVRIAAQALAASGRPGDATFEEARAGLARLCPG